MFAHAAIVFKTIPALAAYATDLQTRAINAWNYYTTHPQNTGLDNGTIMSGNADMDFAWQNQMQVVAAVYMFDLTNNIIYRNYVDANYSVIPAIANSYWDFWNHNQSKALLVYASLPTATASVAMAIKNVKWNSISSIDYYGYDPNLNAYRSYFGTDVDNWGRNQWCANVGNVNKDVANYNIVSSGSQVYLDRAEDILHQFHGVNPFGIVYLSNMYSYGAGASVNTIYHDSYPKGSPWENAKTSANGGPPPGFLPGGPYSGYTDDNGGCTIVPPCGQPAEKSYNPDINDGWPVDSWAFAEPELCYQSAYVELLSSFVFNSLVPLPIAFDHFQVTADKKGRPWLQWRAGNKTETYYVIERSFDGRQFEPIDSVAGDNSLLFNYTDLHLKAQKPSKVYYRLQGVSDAINHTYSDIRSIEWNELIDLDAMANVSSFNGKISIDCNNSRLSTVGLFDLYGRELFIEKKNLRQAHAEFPNTFLRHQFLIVRLTFTDGEVQSKKIFVD